jgi:hypothetical protein
MEPPSFRSSASTFRSIVNLPENSVIEAANAALPLQQAPSIAVDIDAREGFSTQAPACRHCGFGFLFELLDDYYPAPNAAFFVCDQEGRVIEAGRERNRRLSVNNESSVEQTAIPFDYVVSGSYSLNVTVK